MSPGYYNIIPLTSGVAFSFLLVKYTFYRTYLHSKVLPGPDTTRRPKGVKTQESVPNTVRACDICTVTRTRAREVDSFDVPQFMGAH